MSEIVARELTKHYRVADKAPGLNGTLRHFFRRRYRTIEAVRGVSFSIQPGEMTAFLGPNGAGKTTTLKMLTGLVEPTSGSAEVVGFRPFARKRAFLSSITLVMGGKQQLIWDLPPIDTFRINAAVYGVEPKEATRRASELAEMLGILGELGQPVRKLSLGQRMKAELVAALLHRPRLLFLDEPTLGLDVNAQAAVRRFLLEYNQVHGATVLFTSHYMADVTALARRVLLIHEGRLIHDGPLSGLTRRFSPHREVELRLAKDAVELEVAPFGEIRSLEGPFCTLLVPTERVAETVAKLLAALEVVDLTVHEPPLEQVIGRVFETGSFA
jgi:ABC-2 type transport system ATP-binding protein